MRRQFSAREGMNAVDLRTLLQDLKNVRALRFFDELAAFLLKGSAAVNYRTVDRVITTRPVLPAKLMANIETGWRL